MQKITKLGILSVAKIQAIIMAIFGLIIGILIAIVSALHIPMQNAGFGPELGIAAIIIFPIMYAIIGFIAGALGAALYNVIANWIGGIEIEIKK